MNRQFIVPTLHSELDGERQVALARAAEEASELTKEAITALRFGLENRYPETGPTNAEKIVSEFLDIREALVDAGLIASSAELAVFVPLILDILRAIVIEGPQPDVHRETMSRHRREWPTLWLAIDRLVATEGGR